MTPKILSLTRCHRFRQRSRLSRHRQQPIGYSAVDLPRKDSGDNMMGTFVDDAIYNYLNTDARARQRC